MSSSIPSTGQHYRVERRSQNVGEKQKQNMNEPAQGRLHRLFTEGFVARDIAEPIISFDSETASSSALATMEEMQIKVVGVRRNGRICGYVERSQLASDTCGKGLVEFEPRDIVDESTSLGECIERLRDRQRIFVEVLGQVGAIVTPTDLHKPIVRMWLFGIVTLIETGFTERIREKYPSDEWTEFVSDGRVDYARKLQAERQRRGEYPDLLDCLQLSDKSTVITRDSELREWVGFRSRRHGEEVMKQIEALRNRLAHAQEFINDTWQTVAGLAQQIERVIALAPSRVTRRESGPREGAQSSEDA